MINASELRIKTKEIRKRFLDAELQTIENNCLETATKEENGGAVFYCDFDLISNEACKILQENNYHVDTDDILFMGRVVQPTEPVNR